MYTRTQKRVLKEFSKRMLNNELAYSNRNIRSAQYYKNIKKILIKFNYVYKISMLFFIELCILVY